MARNRIHQYLKSFAIISSFALLNLACSTTALEQRIDYWKAQTAAHLPIGASKQQAEEFFSARGAKLICCVSAPPGPRFHYIHERNVGQSLLMQKDVAVLVDLSTDDRVHSVSVQVWGVGL